MQQVERVAAEVLRDRGEGDEGMKGIEAGREGGRDKGRRERESTCSRSSALLPRYSAYICDQVSFEFHRATLHTSVIRSLLSVTGLLCIHL